MGEFLGKMTINISLLHKSYDIIIDKLTNHNFETKVVIVTNQIVSKLHLNYLLNKISAKNLSIITITSGEQYKTLDTIQLILEHCFKHKLNRESLLIAFGGGVIGDITGFTASIYQRGIDFIQIPTTLLSQVDASVGGKTGINNKFGKNLIGTFHQPKAVYIDSIFLNTLPDREFNAGVAEIIKMAVCFDKDFFNWLEQNILKDNQNINIAIEKSIKIKAKIVSQDEKEKGIRACLNYGHTFGHVIENETNYNTYLHGEAVSIGIIMANKLAIKLGFINNNDANKIKTLLKKYNLPTTYQIKNVEDFYQHFFLDKKTNDTDIKFILPVGIGDCKIADKISKDDIITILKDFQ
jgi:3-dehydroquinate synthase